MIRSRRLGPVWLFAPLLVLATCGPAADSELRVARLAPPPPAATADRPARFDGAAFVAADGARLPLRSWLPRGEVKAVILALHGFGDYSNAFTLPGEFWAERGIATYAYDQRGFGGAAQRGLWAGGLWLAGDAILASRILRQLHPGRPLYLLGESMGGAVAIIATTGAAGGAVADVDGLILSAPAVWGRETMELVPRLALFAAVRLFPEATLSGRGLRIRASDNLPMLEALAKDPLIFKGARVDTVYGLVDLMDDAFAAAPLIAALPTLLLYGAHDQVIPEAPVGEFVAHLTPDPAHRRRLAYYRDGYHLLLRDLGAAIVAGDVASWIADPGAPLPSKADAATTAAKWPPRTEGGG
jgi:acylglycerol lipase